MVVSGSIAKIDARGSLTHTRFLSIAIMLSLIQHPVEKAFLA
jgi:hypothetical protein